jgi:hypothetical protein
MGSTTTNREPAPHDAIVAHARVQLHARRGAAAPAEAAYAAGELDASMLRSLREALRADATKRVVAAHAERIALAQGSYAWS